jgi:hypothetical protein
VLSGLLSKEEEKGNEVLKWLEKRLQEVCHDHHPYNHLCQHCYTTMKHRECTYGHVIYHRCQDGEKLAEMEVISGLWSSDTIKALEEARSKKYAKSVAKLWRQHFSTCLGLGGRHEFPKREVSKESGEVEQDPGRDDGSGD